jgi:hypothetical protein
MVEYMSNLDVTFYQRPVEILQNLIRFETISPPGNGAEDILVLQGYALLGLR